MSEETAMQKMRRMVSNLNFEYEAILDDLPSIEAIEEYYDLFSVKYGTDFYSGIVECIAEGDSPKDYNEFVEKYKLDWNKY